MPSTKPATDSKAHTVSVSATTTSQLCSCGPWTASTKSSTDAISPTPCEVNISPVSYPPFQLSTLPLSTITSDPASAPAATTTAPTSPLASVTRLDIAMRSASLISSPSARVACAARASSRKSSSSSSIVFVVQFLFFVFRAASAARPRLAARARRGEHRPQPPLLQLARGRVHEELEQLHRDARVPLEKIHKVVKVKQPDDGPSVLAARDDVRGPNAALPQRHLAL